MRIFVSKSILVITDLNELLRSKLRSIPSGKFFCEPFIPAASCEVFWFKNKRTALTSAGTFLELNGYKLVNAHEEEIEFGIKVDNSNLTVKQISRWLKEH